MSNKTPSEETAEKIIAVFKDRWSIDQEEGWAEFGPDTIDDVEFIVGQFGAEQWEAGKQA